MDSYLAAMEAALADADATVTTDLGGDHIQTSVRLWRGHALVDWEPDPAVGDCLLRPALLRRLIQLQATTNIQEDVVCLEAPGRVVASLSPEHAALVRQLGGARRMQLSVQLAFKDGAYRGGSELFAIVDHGRRIPLLKLSATINARTASPSTSPSKT